MSKQNWFDTADIVTAGTVIGLLADAVKLAFNYLAYRLGVAKLVFWQIVAALFVQPAEIHQPIAIVLGGIADLTAAAFSGVIFLYLLRQTGRDRLWLIGTGFGLLLWDAYFGVLFRPVRGPLGLTAVNIMVTPIAHLLFGLALAFFTHLLLPGRLTEGS